MKGNTGSGSEHKYVANNKGSFYPMSQDSRCSDRMYSIRSYLIAEASFLESELGYKYLVCAGCRMLGYRIHC